MPFLAPMPVRPAPAIADPEIAKVRDRLFALIDRLYLDVPLLREYQFNPEAAKKDLEEGLARNQAQVPALLAGCRAALAPPIIDEGVGNLRNVFALVYDIAFPDKKGEKAALLGVTGLGGKPFGGALPAYFTYHPKGRSLRPQLPSIIATSLAILDGKAVKK